MITIAIMNNKGGVGKSVTTIALADILHRDYHKRVILVDGDGQMNLTRFYLPSIDDDTCITSVDVLIGRNEPLWSDNLMPLKPGLDLLPGSSDLYDLDFESVTGGADRTGAFREFLQCAAEDNGADFALLDCPPGFTTSSVAALTAADLVVIPLLVDGFSVYGTRDMTKQLALLRRANPTAKMAGVLITQWRNTDVVHAGEKLVRGLGVPVFKTVIRRTEKVPESTFDGTPICEYSPHCAAAVDYRRWVQEFLGEVL